MSQPDRRSKVEALLQSPVEGERSAAEAALNRMPQAKLSEPGSKEWFEERREWCKAIRYCEDRITSPVLTAAEVKTIRNFVRSIGDHQSPFAVPLYAIHSKLSAAETRAIEDRSN